MSTHTLKERAIKARVTKAGKITPSARRECVRNLLFYALNILPNDNYIEKESTTEDDLNEVYKELDPKYEEEVKEDLRKIEEYQNRKRNGKLSSDEVLELKHEDNYQKCFDNESGEYLMSQINCDSVSSAKDDFIRAEKDYHAVKNESVNKTAGKGRKNNKIPRPNELFHIIMSFKGKELPAKKVHELGVEFAERVAGGAFRVLVTTHTNTDNYHNHIVISAYAIDGVYKFKDELGLGKKLQDIGDELALENNCEILVEKNKNKLENEQPKESIGEKYYKKNPSKGRKRRVNKEAIRNDIEDCKKNSSTYEQFKEKLESKGYKIQKNNVSYTYIHEINGKIRDNRLGDFYTIEQIKEYFDRKQIISVSIKYRLEPQNIRIPPFKVKKDALMVPVPFIVRLLELIINILRALLMVVNDIEITKVINKEIQKAKDVKEVAEQYKINDVKKIEQTTKQIYMDAFKTNIKYRRNKRIEAEQKLIKEQLEKIKGTKEKLKQEKIDIKDIKVPILGEANYIENRAKLDPMTPKTKSILYKVMHNSGYVLKYNYNQITETQAKEICNYIKKGNKFFNFNIPKELYTLKEYMALKKKNELPNYKSDKNKNLKQYKDKNEKSSRNDYSKEQLDLIKEYKSAKGYLNSIKIEDTDEKLKENTDKYKELNSENNQLLESMKKNEIDMEKLSKINQYLMDYENNEIFGIVDNIEELKMRFIQEGLDFNYMDLNTLSRAKGNINYSESIFEKNKEFLNGKEDEDDIDRTDDKDIKTIQEEIINEAEESKKKFERAPKKYDNGGRSY